MVVVCGLLLGLDGQQPITNDRWINVTQKAHPADLRAGPFLLAVGSCREWDCQTFLSYGYEDHSCTDGVAPPIRAYGIWNGSYSLSYCYV